MSRPIIGLDVDGVLADFGSAFRKLSREMFGRPDKGFIQTSWGGLGVSPEEIDAVWKRIKRSKNWWLSLGKMPGTESLKEMWFDYRIYFITSRVPTAGLPLEVQTAKWIENNYAIPYPTVITEHSKGPIASALGITIFLDDKPENCLDVMEGKNLIHTYLLDVPYNRENVPGTIRVGSVDAFFSELKYGRR